jgi:hypothetical protein
VSGIALFLVYWTSFERKRQKTIHQPLSHLSEQSLLKFIPLPKLMIASYFIPVILCSIMGEGDRHGIVPQFAKELFERVEGTTDDEVGLSMT